MSRKCLCERLVEPEDHLVIQLCAVPGFVYILVVYLVVSHEEGLVEDLRVRGGRMK